jgi:hypothetical protein
LPELFFNLLVLILPSHLLGQGGVTFGQGREPLMGLDACDDSLEFIDRNTLAVVFSVFPYCPIIQTNVFSCSLPIIIAKLTTAALSALYFSAFRKRRKFWTNDFIFESLVIAFPVVMQKEFRNGATQR